jgi:predicted phage tail component-like protein
MGSIIKVPRDTVADYDYIAFSFDGKHSYEDFGIYRVSDGKEGYDESLVSAISDATVEVPGMDGQYFFGTQHKNRVFNIKFAFDSLTEAKLQEMKSWLSGKKIRDLWFDETPYKVYSAKVTGAATITATPFADARDGRVYKGTGTVEFTSYYPYPHTPRWIQYGNT